MELRQQQRPVQTQSLQQRQVISPKMILANRLLQLATVDLHQEVVREMEQNPALEMEEGAQCPRCSATLMGAQCLSCGYGENPQENGKDMDLVEMGRLLQLARSGNAPTPRNGQEDAEEYIYDGATSQELSLHEKVLRTYRLLCENEQDMKLGEELVLYIGNKGLMLEPVAELARLTNASEERVLAAIERFKSIKPYGIGAATVKEALQAQLHYKAPQGELRDRVAQLIDQHFWELGKEPLEALQKALGCRTSEVKEALAYLKRELFPYPGYLFATPEDEKAQRELVVRPNVVIRRDGAKFHCELLENRWSHLRINRDYERLYRKMKDGNLSEDEKEHVRQYFNRAKQFMEALQQRQRTIIRITQKLCEHQRDFLLFGYKSLKSLTRVELAKHLELHEATVSRATAGKYVQVPSGEVLSFDIFFDASLGPKEYIRDLIANEDAKKPFSDQELVKLLKQKGVLLARRTVAKYREEMEILPTYLRKQA